MLPGTTRTSFASTRNPLSKRRCRYAAVLFAVLFAVLDVPSAPAQTVTIVGTQHLTGLDVPPTPEQRAHTIERLSAFEPTQVCVERMGGALIEMQIADPETHGMTLQPDTHGRHLADRIIPAGVQMQVMLEIRARDARDEASRLVARWDELDSGDRIRTIGLEIAGFEFHSAVLNWTYLDQAQRDRAADILPARVIEALDSAASSVHEVYALAVPLARKLGLHELCTADVLQDESSGMSVAMNHGGGAILDKPEVRARFQKHSQRMAAAWRPDDGPGALTAMLRFVNGDEFAELDRRLQWETLREFDNPAGAFHRRLMYWHARTAEISAELYRALAQGPDERVILIIGAAHRPFTEADLRAQPWFEVLPAKVLLKAE